MLVQTFITKLAVEAFDVAVLHRLARLDQQMSKAICLAPAPEDTAGEFGTVVGYDSGRISSKLCRLVEHARHICAAYAEIHDNINSLVAEGGRNSIVPTSNLSYCFLLEFRGKPLFAHAAHSTYA